MRLLPALPGKTNVRSVSRVLRVTAGSERMPRLTTWADTDSMTPRGMRNRRRRKKNESIQSGTNSMKSFATVSVPPLDSPPSRMARPLAGLLDSRLPPVPPGFFSEDIADPGPAVGGDSGAAARCRGPRRYREDALATEVLGMSGWDGLRDSVRRLTGSLQARTGNSTFPVPLVRTLPRRSSQ